MDVFVLVCACHPSQGELGRDRSGNLRVGRGPEALCAVAAGAVSAVSGSL